MICVELYYKKDTIYRFKVSGHAGYADAGSDIVCAGVSTLVINTINSIEELTDEPLSINTIDNKQGIIDCTFSNRKVGTSDSKATILLDSMILGLKSLKQMYGEYIAINTKKND
ncbi:MAG: ribosomal-processing cysteine protease Prp [Cellulosilyticaceae bacterium]